MRVQSWCGKAFNNFFTLTLRCVQKMFFVANCVYKHPAAPLAIVNLDYGTMRPF